MQCAEHWRPKGPLRIIHSVTVFNIFQHHHSISSIPRRHNAITYSIARSMLLYSIMMFAANNVLKHYSPVFVDHIDLKGTLDASQSSCQCACMHPHSHRQIWTVCSTHTSNFAVWRKYKHHSHVILQEHLGMELQLQFKWGWPRYRLQCAMCITYLPLENLLYKACSVHLSNTQWFLHEYSKEHWMHPLELWPTPFHLNCIQQFSPASLCPHLF